MLSGNVMEAKFSGTIDDEPKYLNPPEPDGIKAEIEYLKDKMLDMNKKIPVSMLPNPQPLFNTQDMKTKEFYIEFFDYEEIPQVYVGSPVNLREGMFTRRVKIPYGYHKLVFRDNKWIEI